MSESLNLSRYAIWYARHSYAIFPCVPHEKHPLVENGFLAATTNLTKVSDWWETTPDANIGLPCAPNNFLVLDVDRHADKQTGEIVDGFAAFTELCGGIEPETPTADTGGGGRHYFFKMPDWPMRYKAGPGLDIKVNGYVIAAPSVHPSGEQYRWLPGRALGQIEVAEVPPYLEQVIRRREPPPTPAPRENREAPADHTGRLTDEQVALEAIKRIPADAYDTWVGVGKALHAMGFDLADWEEWSATSPRFESGACEKRWNGFTSGDNPKIAPGYLVNLARESDLAFLTAGWRRNTMPAPSSNGEARHKPPPLRDADAPTEGNLAVEPDPPPPAQGRETKQSAKLLRMVRAAGAMPFHTPNGDPWLAVPEGDQRIALQLGERHGDVNRWLTRLWIEAHEDNVPSSTAIGEAKSALDAWATAPAAPLRKVFLRLARFEGKVYLDLADATWEVVEVDESGWRVLPCPPGLYFRRTSAESPLPRPDPQGTFAPLRALLGPRVDEDNFVLMVAWLLGTLQPDYSYPFLTLYGEQGTGKSSMCGLLRSITDPCGDSGHGVSRQPRDEESLAAVATSRHVLAFDNLSRIEEWFSDALAALSTGAEWGGRKRYTDFEAAGVEAKRPVIFNGITEVATRPDLIDRSLTITLQPMPEDQRLKEKVFWLQAAPALSATLGALLTAASAALAHADQAPGPWPRMADFAGWVADAELGGALPWKPGTFGRVYREARTSSVGVALDTSPLTAPLREFALQEGEWEGSAQRLLEHLLDLATTEERNSRQWPKDAARLAGDMRKLAPALRDAKVAEIGDRKSHGKRLLLVKLPTPDQNDRPENRGSVSPLVTDPLPTPEGTYRPPTDPRLVRQESGKPPSGVGGVGKTPTPRTNHLEEEEEEERKGTHSSRKGLNSDPTDPQDDFDPFAQE